MPVPRFVSLLYYIISSPGVQEYHLPPCTMVHHDRHLTLEHLEMAHIITPTFLNVIICFLADSCKQKKIMSHYEASKKPINKNNRK